MLTAACNRKFAQIPELWDMTSRYVLRDAHLSNIALVNKQVGAVVTPILWYKVDLCDLRITFTGAEALERLCQLVKTLTRVPALAERIKWLVIPANFQAISTTRHRTAAMEFLGLVPNVRFVSIVDTNAIASWHSFVSTEIHRLELAPVLHTPGEFVHRRTGQGFWEQGMFEEVSFKAKKINGAFIGTSTSRAFLATQAASLQSWNQVSFRQPQVWEVQRKLPVLCELSLWSGEKASIMLDSMAYATTLRALDIGREFPLSGFIALQMHTALESVSVDLGTLLPLAARSRRPSIFLKELAKAVPTLKTLMIRGNNFVSNYYILGRIRVDEASDRFHLR